MSSYYNHNLERARPAMQLREEITRSARVYWAMRKCMAALMAQARMDQSFRGYLAA